MKSPATPLCIFQFYIYRFQLYLGKNVFTLPTSFCLLFIKTEKEGITRIKQLRVE